jgi:cation diffusion facilitator family transporter
MNDPAPHDHRDDQDHHDDALPDAGAHHRHGDGLSGWVRSMVTPHSHDPMDAVDPQLASSASGMRALAISLLLLTLTAGAELGILVLSGSVALLGDTVHNFADALTAVPLGLAFWMARKQPTRRYTYGYGRAEDLAGVLIVAAIAASALFTAYEAIDRLIHPQTVHHLGLVMVAGVIGWVGNEVVARYRMNVGRRIGSAALVADGLHARTDGITSLAVVVGAIGVALGIPAADPIMGLLITLAILAVLRTAGRDIYRRLMDSVEPALVDQIVTVVEHVDGVLGVDGVRVRWIGHELRAEVIVVSEGSLSLSQAHAIAEVAHHRLLHEVPRLTAAIIHSDPYAGGQVVGHDLTAHHFA